MSFSKSRVERFPTHSKSSDGTGTTYNKRAGLSSSVIAATPPNATDGRELKDAQSRSTGCKMKATKERISQVPKSHSGSKSGASFTKPQGSPSFRVGRTPTSAIHRKCIIKRTLVKASNKGKESPKCKPGIKSDPPDDVTLPSDSEIFQTPQASEPSDWEDARGSEVEMDHPPPPGTEIQSNGLPTVGESQRATDVVITPLTSDLSEIIKVDNRSESEETVDVTTVIIKETTSPLEVVFSEQEQPTIPVLSVGVDDVSDETNATIITIGRKPRRFSNNKNQVFSLLSSEGVPVPLHAFSFYSTGQFGSIQTMQQSQTIDLNTSRILTSHEGSNRNFISAPLLQHSLQEDSPEGTLFCPLSSSTMWSSSESSQVQGTNTLNAAVAISGNSSESESEYMFGRQPHSSNSLTLKCYQWIVQNFPKNNTKTDKINRSFSNRPSQTSGLNQILADDNDEQRIPRFTPIRHRLTNSTDNHEGRHRGTRRPSFGRSTKRVCRRVWRILQRDSHIVIGQIKNNLLVSTKILLRDHQVWTLLLEFIAGQVLELVLGGISVKITALKQ